MDTFAVLRFHTLTTAQAFRPGNVDLPSNQSHVANPNTLILPDTITDLDLFAPLPDPDELLRQPQTRGPGRDPTLLDFGTSQLLPESQTPSKRQQEQTTFLDDDDLGLDLGLEPNEPTVRSTPGLEDRSIEIGRRAPTPRRDEPTLFDDDLGLDIGDDTTAMAPQPHIDDDVPMLGIHNAPKQTVEDDEIAAANAAALEKVAEHAERRQRDTLSPLSDLRASLEPQLERTFQLDQAAIHEEEDETVVQAAQRVKRRKVIRQDPETELHNSQIKKQQEDRSGITKQPSFLPRDPLLLQLMEMQRNGSFVSNIMGDGLMRGWAPELRGIASLEIVRDRKRKRDSGVADLEIGDERQDSPHLEIPQDDDELLPIPGPDHFGAEPTLHSEGPAPLPMSDAPLPAAEDDGAIPPVEVEVEGELYPGSPAQPFDITEAPLNHPSQTGPVSLGTKNAVHLLREHFAPGHAATSNEPPTPSKRTKNEALFTDLCPVELTSRQDATKMFFELLVLGTKDAVKVEQDTKELGLPIRVRGKRGLWGDWAERGAGGEIAEQQEEAQA